MSEHALKLDFYDKHWNVIHSIIMNSEDYDKIVNNKEIIYEKLGLSTLPFHAKWFCCPITHFILARFHISKFEDVFFQDLVEDFARELEYIRIVEI